MKHPVEIIPERTTIYSESSYDNEITICVQGEARFDRALVYDRLQVTYIARGRNGQVVEKGDTRLDLEEAFGDNLPFDFRLNLPKARAQQVARIDMCTSAQIISVSQPASVNVPPIAPSHEPAPPEPRHTPAMND